jgi:hypothetical protein
MFGWMLIIFVDIKVLVKSEQGNNLRNSVLWEIKPILDPYHQLWILDEVLWVMAKLLERNSVRLEDINQLLLVLDTFNLTPA